MTPAIVRHLDRAVATGWPTVGPLASFAGARRRPT